jgi:hypothetical protein
MQDNGSNVEAPESPTAKPDGAEDATGHRDPDDGKRSEITKAAEELRQLIGLADALASTADEQFCRVVVVGDGGDRRGVKRLAHLVECTASTVLAASDASAKLIAAVERILPLESEERS